MLKVMTVVGTRPEIIRLSRVIDRLDRYCDHTLVHTGQNYDYNLNQVFFDNLGIRKPDVFLEAAGVSPAETIAQVIAKVDTAIVDAQPEALLLLGDTNSCLAAISAKRRKVPIFHMEAGNRCYDFRVPEEINRRIVDHVADINLTYSDIAREYLLREGFPADQIIKTGSPMQEVIAYYAKDIHAAAPCAALGLTPGEYFLVSTHREENVDDPAQLEKIISILNMLASEYDKPVIVSTHPRTRNRLEAMQHDVHVKVRFLEPFGFFDYVNLQLNACCVLSDSGTITEESSILNFAALNMREVHERPEGFEEAAVMMVGLDINRIRDGLRILADQPRGSERILHLVRDYAPDNVSDKVLRILHSYTGFVNRRVWGKLGA
ncbi:MAG TPA: UDP-N-acetylglucosamine 2-epimerase (non-hydrolyzing) [Roseobacter sp.]|uniref:UDP-N-acetylglucosamine 2-epimerase domain-containing protein n=1 Tax=marine sediment metagenome TaxID=412755 RepID=A0A0F9T2R2_9ZZZZ|nr:UDP-N-acetylglucosamine 2-epimerase (non-hydrolyzing) [Roseobacter sp.]|tara:strand:- start:37 stop:1167 length:1131 start_codon:yes stop_codon:yes gene_type:complete